MHSCQKSVNSFASLLSFGKGLDSGPRFQRGITSPPRLPVGVRSLQARDARRRVLGAVCRSIAVVLTEMLTKFCHRRKGPGEGHLTLPSLPGRRNTRSDPEVQKPPCLPAYRMKSRGPANGRPQHGQVRAERREAELSFRRGQIEISTNRAAELQLQLYTAVPGRGCRRFSARPR